MPMSESYNDDAVNRITTDHNMSGSGISPNTWVLIYVSAAFAVLYLIRYGLKGA